MLLFGDSLYFGKQISVYLRDPLFFLIQWKLLKGITLGLVNQNKFDPNNQLIRDPINWHSLYNKTLRNCNYCSIIDLSCLFSKLKDFKIKKTVYFPRKQTSSLNLFLSFVHRSHRLQQRKRSVQDQPSRSVRYVQVRLGQVRLGQVRLRLRIGLGQVGLGKDRLSQFRLKRRASISVFFFTITLQVFWTIKLKLKYFNFQSIQYLVGFDSMKPLIKIFVYQNVSAFLL